MRAAAISASSASPGTPAISTSSGTLTARSSGRALGGLQRGAECRTRGELDRELAALCRAVTPPTLHVLSNLTTTLKDLQICGGHWTHVLQFRREASSILGKCGAT